jgi:hypothetical protein
MMANCVPIYWGNPLINMDFNSNSIINWNDFGSDEKVIQEIIKLDNNNDLYVQFISQKYVNNEDLFTIEYVLNFFDKIIK